MNFICPAEDLENKQLSGTLGGTWTVGARIIPSVAGNATGGYFSVIYHVQDATGQPAFLKALDITKVMANHANPALALQEMLAAFNFECNILDRCRTRRLNRIVLALDHGTLSVSSPFPTIVPFLIFEKADGDVRKHLSTLQAFDVAFTVRCIHHITAGLQQLHTNKMAHQDVKPSNMLVFSGTDTKIADLGRSVAPGLVGPHSSCDYTGDLSYAPPEIKYGQINPDSTQRHFATDLYQLGSMIMFLFQQVTMNGRLSAELDPSHHWPTVHSAGWTGTFTDVLPYIRAAYDLIMDAFEQKTQPLPIEPLDHAKLCLLTRSLCEPDPNRRGHPTTLQQRIGNVYALNRYVADFDVIARRAEARMKGTRRP